ncbi:MAG: hypothetical protein IKL53_10220 [Lachnospiraceae bacterium]|nr:hypothetical protein [Lachnospiraceae bacterium]
MRYFVLTNDNNIVPAYMVYKDDGVQHFCANNRSYRFSLSDEYMYGSRFFQVYKRCGEWEYTLDIKYFYVLDEEENEDLNYFESTDFNAGAIYTRMEKVLIKNVINTEANEVVSFMELPKIQMICHDSNCDDKIINNTLDKVQKHFDAVYGKSYELIIHGWKYRKQYVYIDYRIVRKERPKELTIKEIEELLGYKIKVVGEKHESN